MITKNGFFYISVENLQIVLPFSYANNLHNMISYLINLLFWDRN